MAQKDSQRFNQSLAVFFSLSLRVEDLPLRRAPLFRPGKGANSSFGHVELPPYLARVLDAVGSGANTSRLFANLHKIPVARASEYFSELAALGWIERGLKKVDGYHYMLSAKALARASASKEVPLKK